MATRHIPHQPGAPDSRQHELDRLLRDINQQQVKPEAHEVIAMAVVLLVFIGAVLVFSLAATQTI